MDEYIKREDAIRHLRGACIAKYPLSFSHGIFASADEINKLPTADVAPKSVVANEVLDEAIRTVYSKIDMKIYNTIDGKPLSDHVAYGKQMAMYDVITLLAELKKKYTEEKE